MRTGSGARSWTLLDIGIEASIGMGDPYACRRSSYHFLCQTSSKAAMASLSRVCLLGHTNPKSAESSETNPGCNPKKRSRGAGRALLGGSGGLAGHAEAIGVIAPLMGMRRAFGRMEPI
jgi:hypothetical protein